MRFLVINILALSLCLTSCKTTVPFTSSTKEELEKYLSQAGLKIIESGYASRESGEKNIFIVCQKQ
jgi:isopropylmalate/homocitrate/citramalate synthase